MSRRTKTNYPGVFYREAKRIGGKGIEKVYYVVFKKDGKFNEEKVGRQYADDMTPARAAPIRGERIEGKRMSRKEIKQQVDAQKASEDSKYTIDRLWKEYKENCPGLKGMRTYKSQYKLYIKPGFGNKEPGEILQLDIDRLRLKMLKKRKPQTVKHVLSLINRLVNFGIKKQLCSGLGFTIEMPTVHNLKTEDLNQNQIVKLLKTIDEDTYPQAGPMMKMAFFTGMRRGEMFRLQWRDINYDRGFIHIRDPKGGPEQKIPLNEATRKLLENHLKTGSPYVFPGRNGRKRTNIGKQVRKIANKAGIPTDFRPLHGLRHVYASMLASSGKVDMYALQKLLTPLLVMRKRL